MRRSTTIRVGGMFNGTEVKGPSAVTIEGKKITAVTEGPAHRPETDSEWDFGDKSFLVPGLIDAHVHLSLKADDDPVAALKGENEVMMLERMQAAARSALMAGITTIRDLGDRNFLSLDVAHYCERNIGGGPTIVAAGPPLTTPGGHCNFLGGETMGIAALRNAVRERQQRGCQVVKIMVSGGHITPGSSPYVSQYNSAEIRAVVDEAHRLGLRVAAHAHSRQAIADALTAGVDSLEHATFLTPDGPHADKRLLGRLAASGVFVSATLGKDPGVAFGFPPKEWAGAKEIYRRLHAHGVRMVAGTDAGIARFKPHDVLPYALHDLVKIGMSPVAALAAMTSEAADLCGLAGLKGSIRTGVDADLLVLSGSPIGDISQITAVAAVFRHGTRVR